MTDQELMVGLFAYDGGAVCSGINDEVAKADLFARFHTEVKKTGKDPEAIIDYATWLLSPEGKKQGYTIEDVASFLKWLTNNGYDIL